MYTFFLLCHQLYEELDKTLFTLVETAEQLQELSQRLSAVCEFAVDLEVQGVKSIEVSCYKAKNATGHLFSISPCFSIIVLLSPEDDFLKFRLHYNVHERICQPGPRGQFAHLEWHL